MPKADLQKLAARALEFEADSNGLWVGAATELEEILKAVEEELYGRRGALLAALETEGGKLVQGAANFAAAQQVYDDTLAVIREIIPAAGYDWVENWVNKASQRGDELGVWTVQGFGDLVRNREVLIRAFRNFSEIEGLLITSAMEEGFRVLDTYGANIADYFRRETLRAIIEGIPVQSLPGSKADSLAKRIWEGGRIGKGKLPSITQRAITMARVELPKLELAVYTQKAQELGLTWGINVNPMDERSTDICEEATLAGAMSYEDWINSYGLPPRLNPFHLCRSQMVWGQKEWLN